MQEIEQIRYELTGCLERDGSYSVPVRDALKSLDALGQRLTVYEAALLADRAFIAHTDSCARCCDEEECGQSDELWIDRLNVHAAAFALLPARAE